jgi:hypothetical protein
VGQHPDAFVPADGGDVLRHFLGRHDMVLIGAFPLRGIIPDEARRHIR